MKKYQQHFNDELLGKLQHINKLVQQLNRTQTPELLQSIMSQLQSNEYFPYLIHIIHFFQNNFPPPFNLINLDLLREGNTFHEWIKQEHQCEFIVKQDGVLKTILYPAFPAPAAVFRNLQHVANLSYKLPNTNYQSPRQLQAALYGFHLWHENQILYQSPVEKGPRYLMISTAKYWKTRKEMLFCQKTMESLYAVKYCANSRQMLSNMNEAIHMEFLCWVSFIQNCSPLCWSLYMDIMELKHNKLATDFMINHPQRFPNFSDQYINSLGKLFEEMCSFQKAFEKANRNGYDQVIIRPIEGQCLNTYINQGLVSQPKWGYKDTIKLTKFVTKHLGLKFVTKHLVHDCWSLFKHRYSIDFIRTKLEIEFFKYI